MSRIAKYPVELPKGVDVTLATAEISVKGPLGTLKQAVHPAVSIEREGDKLQCKAVRAPKTAVPIPAQCERFWRTWCRASPRASRRS